MATKSNKKGPLGQDASHMGNPLRAFRDGGQKRVAAYKTGGHNAPKSALPKRFEGGPEDSYDPNAARTTVTTSPYETKKQKILGIIPTGNTIQTRYGDERSWNTGGKGFQQTQFKEKNVVGADGTIKKSVKSPIDDMSYSKKTDPYYEAGSMQTAQNATPYFNKKGGSVKSKKKK